MKILWVAILLVITGCGSQQPVAQVTIVRAGKVVASNPNVIKVINQLSGLYKAKGVSAHDFIETRRALGGVISDHAGHELHPIFVLERYRTTIVDLYRSYTESHYNALNQAIDNLAKAKTHQKTRSHLREIEGLIRKYNSKASQRDTIFQRVVPHNQRATNIKKDLDEVAERQRIISRDELQKKFTNAILQMLDNYRDKDQGALLVIGENIRRDLKWLR